MEVVGSALLRPNPNRTRQETSFKLQTRKKYEFSNTSQNYSPEHRTGYSQPINKTFRGNFNTARWSQLGHQLSRITISRTTTITIRFPNYSLENLRNSQMYNCTSADGVNKDLTALAAA